MRQAIADSRKKEEPTDALNEKLSRLLEEYKKFQDRKVRHHCHLTGPFMGAACNSCNLAHSFGRMVKKKNDRDRQEVG